MTDAWIPGPAAGAAPKLQIDVLTLFPALFPPVFEASILGRARRAGLWDYRLVDFRAYACDRHRTVDDVPYGGGDGMVLKVPPIARAVEGLLGGPEAFEAWLSRPKETRRPKLILLTPQGERLTHGLAERLSREAHLILLAGHYEGFDERIREHLATDEVSIGDFVLTGGELPAMVLVDAVVRLLPGVLGGERSSVEESFAMGRLEYPHYTRPPSYRGWEVPAVLRSGHHARIAAWRKEQALLRTLLRRPDLLWLHPPDAEEAALLRRWADLDREEAALAGAEETGGGAAEAGGREAAAGAGTEEGAGALFGADAPLDALFRAAAVVRAAGGKTSLPKVAAAVVRALEAAGRLPPPKSKLRRRRRETPFYAARNAGGEAAGASRRPEDTGEAGRSGPAGGGEAKRGSDDAREEAGPARDGEAKGGPADDGRGDGGRTEANG
ncbi:tRNA (guanosine(37)-N1)-methyltransferase TrmD [Hydrogenibacillus schlegelii]|uniref:tRNA (guanosine(37)-N1)-methyltransferase TrmD n=1 Tax=Hydrogenibacillus schlegelii TaxID=1484 RepID=UPI0008249C72